MVEVQLLTCSHVFFFLFFPRAEKTQYETSKSYLTDLLNFYDKITRVVKEGRAVDVTFARPFNTVSHNSVVSKLGHYR